MTSLTPTFAPSDWKSRAIPIRVERHTGWCMEPHDLVLSKPGAGREKDLDFARGAAKLGLVRRDELIRRLAGVGCTEDHRQEISARIDSLLPPGSPATI